MKSSPGAVLKGLSNGKISKLEADFYLRQMHGMSLEQATTRQKRIRLSYTLSIFCAVLVVAFAILLTGSPAGLVTYDGTSGINLENVTGINISGTLYGDGNASVYLETPEGDLLVASITSDDGSPMTVRASYTPGELIDIVHAPQQASYYLEVDGASSSVQLPFEAPSKNATLLIVAQVNDTPITYRTPVIIGNTERIHTFEQLCEQTCVMNMTNGTLRIEEDGASLNITFVYVTKPEANSPPRQSAAFPTIVVNGTAELNLSSYFIDEDDDELVYSIGSSDLITTQLRGSVLMMSAVQSGEGTLSVYASDLKELVPAQLAFRAVVSQNTSETAQVAEVNISGNDSPVHNESNLTEAVVDDAVNASTDAAALPLLDCSSQNPNERPVDCLNANASTYFEEDIYLENIDRTQVARITPIGNLVITGRIMRNATGSPGPRDFTIGYKDNDFNYIPTIWIDVSGDLHIKGRLYEEIENLVPASGSYAIMNRRGIYMAYADTVNGDLYLRGNLIMFREDIHE